MELKLNNMYSNFKLIRIDEVKEIHSKAFIFEHNMTKTQVLFLDNTNNDKSFAITFKTLPKFSDGVAHILEHSVLNGSEKYPLKDPFMELNRSSINTFLNAFTFPDKTMYPFSTTNQSEFMKIMDIYLDAVFFPKVRENKKIFLQEGWRYELFDKKDEIKYSGVVYGEMKGAMSSPDRVLEQYTQQDLLENTVYGVNSGGEPKNIVDLTYEDFLDFHSRYYHPSNSNIVLYGNLDIFDSLKLIDENFLSKFNFLEIKDEIKFEKPFEKQKEVEYEYSTSKEDIENKSLFGISFIIGNALDSNLIMGFKLLSSILLDLEASPLKKALIDNDLAQEVYGGFQEDLIQQPVFGVYLNNANKNNKEKFVKVFNETLNNIVKEGLDKDLVDAVLKSTEFSLKEGKFTSMDFLTKGVEYSIVAQDSWLYRGDPLMYLKFNSNLQNIKKKAFEGYFEELIEKYLIKNKHSVVLSLHGNSNINFEEYEKKKLSEYKKTLSDSDLDNLIKQSNEVLKYQEAEDTPEIIDSIKVIKREDINIEPQRDKFEKLRKLNGIDIVKVETDVDDITYLDFYFDLKVKSEEQLQYLALLTEFIDELGTKNISADNFSNEINKYFGNLSFELVSFSKKSQEDIFGKLLISSKFLTENTSKVIELFNDIFNNLEITKKKLKEMLKQTLSEIQSGVVSSGHQFASMSVQSKYSNRGVFNELIHGISYFEFIKSLLDNFEEKNQEILSKLNNVYVNSFSSKGLSLCFASKDFDYKLLKNLNLSQNDDLENNINNFLEKNKDNIAIVCSTNVNYVCQGGFFDSNLYKGDLYVLKKILSRKYLYDEIRVKGGAYGNGSNLTYMGGAMFFSYRDPNLNRTLDVYNASSKFIENLDLTEDDLHRYIVGSINDLDQPLETEDIMKKVMNNLFCEISFEDICKERKEILNSNLIQIKNRSLLVKSVLEQNHIAVVCSENSLKGNEEKFTKIIRI